MIFFVFAKLLAQVHWTAVINAKEQLPPILVVSSSNSWSFLPSVKVANMLWVILLWSSSWQSNPVQETFFLFTKWNCSAASADCDASRISRSSSSCTIGPIVLATSLHRSCPHSCSNNRAANVWGSHNPTVRKLNKPSCPMTDTNFFIRLFWAFALAFRISWPPIVPLLQR